MMTIIARFAPWLIGGLGVVSLLMGGAIWLLMGRLETRTSERDAAIRLAASYQATLKAREGADTKAREREDVFDQGTAALGTSGDPVVYLCRLHARQTGTDPAACDAPLLQD